MSLKFYFGEYTKAIVVYEELFSQDRIVRYEGKIKHYGFSIGKYFIGILREETECEPKCHNIGNNRVKIVSDDPSIGAGEVVDA